jgi:hypothetical protein
MKKYLMTSSALPARKDAEIRYIDFDTFKKSSAGCLQET